MKFIGKMMLASLSILVFQLLAGGQTLTTDQVFDKMEKANVEFPSLKASITRTAYTDLVGKFDEPQLGTIWILGSKDAPRQIKVEFTKPVSELVLINEKEFIHYYPRTKDGEIKKNTKDGQAEGECVFLGLCQSKEVIKKNYIASVVGQESITVNKTAIPTVVLELKPKDKKRAQGIASIKMWLDLKTWHTIQTRISEENKNYTNAVYSNITTAKVSDSVFDVKISRDHLKVLQ